MQFLSFQHVYQLHLFFEPCKISQTHILQGAPSVSSVYYCLLLFLPLCSITSPASPILSFLLGLAAFPPRLLPFPPPSPDSWPVSPSLSFLSHSPCRSSFLCFSRNLVFRVSSSMVFFPPSFASFRSLSAASSSPARHLLYHLVQKMARESSLVQQGFGRVHFLQKL